MKKKWQHEPCVLFLEDAFSVSDAERLREAGYCQVERFADHFRDEETEAAEQSVKDPRIIRFCNARTWMLVTLDSDMVLTHVEEIKKNPRSCILATAHNRATDTREWIEALAQNRATFERYWKKHERPCFATFNRQGKITTHRTIMPTDTTRRNRPREAEPVATVRLEVTTQ
jgi:predicted nuclease of predicted toxin-antitoxin system